MAKLTESQVASIRQQYAAGWVLLRDLAAEHGVSVTTVWQIVRREIWRQVPPVPGEAEIPSSKDRAAERAREAREMAALRDAGKTWQAIGDRYGMTPQGARKRVGSQIARKD